jgi:hypothetical protein
METMINNPFFIFGIPYQDILIISGLIALISFVVMFFSLKIGGILFQISIGILVFMLVYWIAAFFYYVLGFDTVYLESAIFYIFLFLLVLAVINIYMYLRLYHTFFETE